MAKFLYGRNGRIGESSGIGESFRNDGGARGLEERKEEVLRGGRARISISFSLARLGTLSEITWVKHVMIM